MPVLGTPCLLLQLAPITNSTPHRRDITGGQPHNTHNHKTQVDNPSHDESQSLAKLSQETRCQPKPSVNGNCPELTSPTAASLYNDDITANSTQFPCSEKCDFEKYDVNEQYLERSYQDEGDNVDESDCLGQYDQHKQPDVVLQSSKSLEFMKNKKMHFLANPCGLVSDKISSCNVTNSLLNRSNKLNSALSKTLPVSSLSKHSPTRRSSFFRAIQNSQTVSVSPFFSSTADEQVSVSNAADSKQLFEVRID